MAQLHLDFFAYLIILSLAVTTCLNIWFKTLFPVHLINTIFRPKNKLYTDEDLENYFIEHLDKYSVRDFSIAELLRCYICKSIWITIVLTFIVALYFLFPISYVPLLIICVPSIAHILYNLSK